MRSVKATLLYIIKDGRVLLVYKKRGHGEGKWNGIGGKIADGENPLECVIREAREEVGIEVGDIRLHGIIYFYNVYGKDWEVCVFRTSSYEGDISESEEVFPKWFEFSEIPYNDMWEDDKEWLPHLIRGDYFIGNYYFEGDKLVKSELNLVSEEDLLKEYQIFVSDDDE
uniref:Oxidized purine nucleoside triphosphate hydrolase n=1 Tax=candidate division WOR-3 bacterium TaxID=2052148 RepID=A0A7V4E4M4_UNCW3